MNLLLIDGDEVAYKAASTSIDNDPERFERSEEEVINKIENIFSTYLHHLEANYDITITDYNFFLGGVNNFRKTLFPEYKSHRKLKETPPLLEFARNYIVEHLNGFVAHGVESDDAIVATYYEWLNSPFFNPKEDVIIIASRDKDFQQVPCIFELEGGVTKNGLFDTYHTRMEVRMITIDEANRFFYKQMLMGDNVDGIKGIAKVGEKTAEKILGDAVSEYSLIKRAFTKYKSVYKGKAREMWIGNYTMLRMRRGGIKTPIRTTKVVGS